MSAPRPWTDSVAPTLDDFLHLAEAAWMKLPDGIRAAAGAVVFRIEDFAEDDVLEDFGIEDPFELSGLYVGDALTEMSVTDPSTAAPMVFLYRQPILDEWLERGDVTLGDLVAHVLVHEVGHHFGLSDEAIELLLGED